MSSRPGPGDDHAARAAEVVRSAGGEAPRVAIVLGSGLDPAVASMEISSEWSYGDLSGFPAPSVPGHAGRLAVGSLASVPVVVFRGRIHAYEGYSMAAVTLPTRVAAELGAGTLVSTAAAGGLDTSLEPGSLVVVADHLSFLGENPLRGWWDAAGTPPFVDLGRAYDPAIAEIVLGAAVDLGIPATTGVYAAMPGPTYETPGETEFLRRAGATVVGMSVVPEALAAAALGLRFAALCCVTNVVGAAPVSHHEVTETAARFATRLSELLGTIVPKL